MANDYFRFKQFEVWHDRCAMKVGTDGVLLGCLARGERAKKGLDVGTGTGLISLMLAQRFSELKMEAIDIDGEAVKQARENVEKSPFRERIVVDKEDFTYLDYKNRKYDLIVSNPPFYEEKTKCANEQRNASRHTESLPFETLIENASKMLNNDGVFAVIIPYVCAADFILNCSLNKLYLFGRTNIKTTERKVAKRVVLQFSKEMRETAVDTLLLNGDGGERSKEYSELTKDFYL